MSEPEEEPLSEKQAALLVALREIERRGEVVDFSALARSTGYSDSSIRTYFTKRLEGVIVFRHGDDWHVKGALKFTEEAFGRRMSQKATAAAESLRTEASWRALLRKLLYEGARRHYHLSDEELELVDDLRPLPAPAPPAAPQRTDEVPKQPSLFGRR